MKTFKTMGLEYYVTDCDNIQQAVETFIKNKIGVTTKDIYEWDQVIPQGATIFTYITKSNRELALEWWSKVPNKPEIADKYGLGYITIQEWQIEEIWENELQETEKNVYDFDEYKAACRAEWAEYDNELSTTNVPQVDFESLIGSIDKIQAAGFCEHMIQTQTFNHHTEDELFEKVREGQDAKQNLRLFFQLLSEKQSFAVLAHKTLKSLKK